MRRRKQLQPPEEQTRKHECNRVGYPRPADDDGDRSRQDEQKNEGRFDVHRSSLHRVDFCP